MPVSSPVPRPNRSSRRIRAAVAAAIACVAFAALAAAALPQTAGAGKAPVYCYRGLGTWVDMYDARALDHPVSAARNMAAHGVHTLYLETANYHKPEDATTIYRPDAVGALIEQCHARGIKVVAWYLPGFQDTAKDYRRSRAAIKFRTPGGQKFDSFALDIEATIVRNAGLRTRRLLSLSRKIRATVGSKYPLGAITMSPAGMAKYPSVWPGFPYKGLAAIYDAFVPMGYYTYHGDGYANAYRDTVNNIRIIREKTGRPSVPIHVIGGDAAKSSNTETMAYVRALREYGALGGSMYDWATTSAASWKTLLSVRFNPRQRPSLPCDLPLATPLGNLPEKMDRTHPKEVFYQTSGQKGDRVLRFDLYDAQADEIRLVVNWEDLGVLAAGPVKSWTGVREVTVPAAVLNPRARNVIGFVARGDYPRWDVWGVRDVSLSAP